MMVKGHKKSIQRLKCALSAAGLLNKSGELEKEKMRRAGVKDSTIGIIEKRLAGESYAKIGELIDEKGFNGRTFQAVRVRINRAISLCEMLGEKSRQP